MDLGMQTWDATILEKTGGHIIRGNTISHCGVCGIAGVLGVYHTLIENNTIEYIGGLQVEGMCECAGLKFHSSEHCLFRGNIFRHFRFAFGIWLDCDNVNNRITSNVFHDIETLIAAIYSEMNFDPNMADHNVVWDIRAADMEAGGWITFNCDWEKWLRGSGIASDCNESFIVAHNFIGNVEGYGVGFAYNQNTRPDKGRTGLCYANEAYNNVFYRTPHRVHIGIRNENRCDGNLYDVLDDNCSFQIAHPEPGCHQNLASWQRYFGLDRHSTQGRITAEFDVDTCTLTWHTDDQLPETQPVAALPGSAHTPKPGPRMKQ
jgi:hypothetical protein